MERRAFADWRGTLRSGKGRISTQSGAVSQVAYSYGTRFEGDPGTNPEELIGVAHAACFTMALAGWLEKLGLRPENLHTDASVKFEKRGEAWSIVGIHLSTYGFVPGATDEKFREAAEEAKRTCPVSRVLNMEVTLEARLMAERGEGRMYA